MKQAKLTFAAGLLTAGSLLAGTGAANAQVFVETTDAGQTLATADSTAATPALAGTPLTTITGTFNTASDADLYAIDITSPSTFSATTNNLATNLGGTDTELFLFNSSGVAIAANDDAAGGTTLDSTLPSGSTLLANLTAGTYYLGISTSGNEPINSASQLLFSGYPGGDTTAVRGPANETNPTSEATFNDNPFDSTTSGAYEIDLTSAATAINPVPEPSTWSAAIAGGVASAFAFLRRRRPNA
jgi:hypothetical protein